MNHPYLQDREYRRSVNADLYVVGFWLMQLVGVGLFLWGEPPLWAKGACLMWVATHELERRNRKRARES